MGQYTPTADLPAPLSRRLTGAEYSDVIRYAERLGIKNAFVQSLESAKESFIPEFDFWFAQIYTNFRIYLTKNVYYDKISKNKAREGVASAFA